MFVGNAFVVPTGIGFGWRGTITRRWQILGQLEGDFREDHDAIDVDSHQGPCQQIQVTVKDAPIEVTNTVVTFANDQNFSPKIRHQFAEGPGGHVIDHSGERRTINRIKFTYKSISRREGKGTVAVLAR